jgi:hypothetical protein
MKLSGLVRMCWFEIFLRHCNQSKSSRSSMPSSRAECDWAEEVEDKKESRREVISTHARKAL